MRPPDDGDGTPDDDDEGGRKPAVAVQSSFIRMAPKSSTSLLCCRCKVLLRDLVVFLVRIERIRSTMAELPEFDRLSSLGRCGESGEI